MEQAELSLLPALVVLRQRAAKELPNLLLVGNPHIRQILNQEAGKQPLQEEVRVEILVQPRRDRWAALRFFRKLLHTAERAPRVIITDKLRSYAAAKKLILPSVEHRQSRYLNNRAENSHQPTRMRERQMKRFQSPECAQRFLCVFESINAIFRLRRHLLSAARHRRLLKQAFHLWNKTAIAALLP